MTVGEWERYRQRKLKLEPQQDERGLLDLFVEHQILLYLADRGRVDVTDVEIKEDLVKLGLGSDDDLKNGELLQSAREDLRAQKWMKTAISPNLQVMAEEAEAYYRQNLAAFVQPDTFQVCEILVPDVVFADKLYRQLRRQPMEDFLRAARQYSKAASAANGGELGTFRQGELPENFEKAILRLRPGEISRPVKSDLGYHLFLLEERLRRHQQRFPEVRDQIFEELLSGKESRAIRDYMASVRRELKIDIFDKNLSFSGSGEGNKK